MKAYVMGIMFAFLVFASSGFAMVCTASPFGGGASYTASHSMYYIAYQQALNRCYSAGHHQCMVECH